MSVVLAESAGLLGCITVSQTHRVRRLKIGNTVQGASFLVPESTDVYTEGGTGPGPVTQAWYQLAWLFAGICHPRGVGLMIGLGSGSGAVALLHHFRGLTLDVVEIDPAVIRLALRYFPLLDHFQRQGSLRVVEASAEDYLAAVRKNYAFILTDVFFDETKEAATLMPTPLLHGLAATSPDIWVNSIGSLDGPCLYNFMELMDQTGNPVRHLTSPIRRSAWLPLRRNWIITTATMNITQAACFTPYPNLAGEAVDASRRAFRTLIDTWTAREEAEAMRHATAQRLGLSTDEGPT